jgi:hypothetical protein
LDERKECITGGAYNLEYSKIQVRRCGEFSMEIDENTYLIMLKRVVTGQFFQPVLGIGRREHHIAMFIQIAG